MTLSAVLTIAGSDPSGGAGIQADLKVFALLGVHGLSAVTAITAQNTLGVQNSFSLPREQLAAQLESVAEDIPVRATKTGMLPTVDLMEEVCQFRDTGHLGVLVIDPVLASTTGAGLSGPGCLEFMRDRLMPGCRLITPNIGEAAALTGGTIDSEADAEAAARALVEAGAGAACVTGGHAAGKPVDVLFDGEQTHRFPGERIGTGPVHGTGCVFSAAAVAFLALGFELPAAVLKAKRLVEQAIGTVISPGAGMLLPGIPAFGD